MKLRSLSLTNVRKFAGRTATISGIGDGVSVVAEANEFGKSTFFDALHALFFLKYGAATREVKSLQPRAGGAVRVSAQIELDQGIFTVEKSFLAQKRASVHDAAGTLVALDDEAENWIARLMGTGLEGPAGLLWVRQGVTALEPAGATPKERENLLGARQNLLSSVAGEIDMITGGRRMDRVIEAASQALARLATGGGQPKAGGPWKDAELDLQTHAARHAELARACTELSEALAERREVTAQLALAEAPGAQDALTRDLEGAQQAHDTALAHAEKLVQAEGQVRLFRLEQDEAQRQLDALIASAQRLEIAQKGLGEAQLDLEEVGGRLEAAEGEASDAQAQSSAAAHILTAAVQARDAAQQSALRRNAAEKAQEWRERLEQVSAKRSALVHAKASLSTHRVTSHSLVQIEQSQTDLARLQAEAAAGAMQMLITYDGAHKITRDGAPLAGGAHTVESRQEFVLEGIGRMILDPGAAAVDLAAVAQAEINLKAALHAVGMPDLGSARQGAAQRREIEAQIALLTGVLDTLAPEGVEQMQDALAQAVAAVAELAEASGNDPRDAAEVAQALDMARVGDEAARLRYDTARDRRDTVRSIYARAQADFEAAQAEMERAIATYGAAQSFDDRRAQAARDLATRQVATQDAQAAMETLRGAAPDMETAKAALTRAKSSAENAREARSQLRSRAAALSATIRTRAEDGVEEKRDEAEGLMQAATARAARFAHEAAALRMLVDALRAKRGAAQETYFGPVQQELAPLLALLHADAALSFDPASMLPQGLARGGAEEQMEMLSGGTQEQIAILTRLAFARLFAREGKPMPVILDDALVYSDDTRITAMFTALHRVAADQQVIVFTCRQMAFAGLGGVRPHVEVVQDR